MTIKSVNELFAWALSHGFAEREPGTIVCTWRGVDWVLSRDGDEAVLSHEQAGRSERYLYREVSSSAPLELGKEGMPEGMGFKSLATDVFLSSPQGSTPPWFTEDYTRRLREHAAAYPRSR